MQLDAPERGGRGGGSESNGDIKAGGPEHRQSLCETLGYRRKERKREFGTMLMGTPGPKESWSWGNEAAPLSCISQGRQSAEVQLLGLPVHPGTDLSSVRSQNSSSDILKDSIQEAF